VVLGDALLRGGRLRRASAGPAARSRSQRERGESESQRGYLSGVHPGVENERSRPGSASHAV